MSKLVSVALFCYIIFAQYVNIEVFTGGFLAENLSGYMHVALLKTGSAMLVLLNLQTLMYGRQEMMYRPVFHRCTGHVGWDPGLYLCGLAALSQCVAVLPSVPFVSIFQ